MRALVLAATAIWFVGASVSHPRAEDMPLLGRPVTGVTVTLDVNGKIAFRTSDLVVLEDGRQLRRVEGDEFRLLSKDDASADPADISGLDFLLEGSDLIRQRVRVMDGMLSSADVKQALLVLKGGSVWVRFAGAARDAVRQVVIDCSGYTRNESKCGYNVVGTVKEESYGDKFELIDVVLEPRTKPSTSTSATKKR